MTVRIKPTPPVLLTSLAVAVFASMAVWVFAGLWGAGISDHLARSSRTAVGDTIGQDYQFYNDADTVFVAWLVARNARTMTEAPRRMFDAEHCAPAEKTLAFGEPILTFGLVAVPAWIATQDSIATYNITIFFFLAASATAMFALVADWTGSLPAGIVAGVLYAFHAEHIADITHLFVYDTTWIVLAWLFARRWLVGARWRDLAALTIAGSLQIGTSLYPILAALLVSLPLAAALVAGYGVGKRQLRQAPVLVVIIGLVAYAVFSPYLSVRESTETLRRSEQLFAAWSWLTPHGDAGTTWIASVLALAGLFLAPRRARDAVLGSATLRGSVALGAMLAAAAATGPNQPAAWHSLWGGAPPFDLPNLYALLADFLPGLDAVRVPARMDTGYHLGLCLLAGFGTASVLGRVKRLSSAVAALLVVVAVAESAMLLGPLRPSVEHKSLLRAGANPDDLALFRSLAASGNRGPLLELPIGDADREYVFRAPARILLSSHHGRRTSACYGSFHPPGREALRRDALKVLEPEARQRLCALGFTTAIVHLDIPLGRHQSEQLLEEGLAGTGPIRYLGSSPSMTAFTLCEAHDAP